MLRKRAGKEIEKKKRRDREEIEKKRKRLLSEKRKGKGKGKEKKNRMGNKLSTENRRRLERIYKPRMAFSGKKLKRLLKMNRKRFETVEERLDLPWKYVTRRVQEPEHMRYVDLLMFVHEAKMTPEQVIDTFFFGVFENENGTQAQDYIPEYEEYYNDTI